MSSEMIFETKDEKRYAPSTLMAYSPPTPEVDEELERQIKTIPDKLAFKIGEVANLVGVKPYVLRYWESEFNALKPQKSRHNQRVYTRKDVEQLMMIKKLLYRDRYSIEGARAALGKLKKETKKVKVIQGAASQIEELRDQTQDLLAAISRLKRLFE